MKKSIAAFSGALVCLILTGALLTGCVNTQAEPPPALPSSDENETPSPSPEPAPETTEPQKPESPETTSVSGTWIYSHSTEGDEELPLSLYEFSVSPPYLEISEDNVITAHFYESVREGKLFQTSPGNYTITDILVNAEGSRYHEDLDDYIRYDPGSGDLRYTLSIADVHHYFIPSAD